MKAIKIDACDMLQKGAINKANPIRGGFLEELHRDRDFPAFKISYNVSRFEHRKNELFGHGRDGDRGSEVQV